MDLEEDFFWRIIMKNKIILSFLCLFLLLGFLPLECQQSFMLKKDIVVGKDEVQDNIFTIGGNVLVEGKVKKSVVALGGTIVINGEVQESVVGIGSSITLKSSAIIKQDVVSLGGTLNKEPGCVVGGDTVYFKGSEIGPKLLKGEFMKGIFSFTLIPIILIFKLISIFIWFLLAFAVAAIFPRQISFASTQIRNSFWPIFGTGFLVIIIFVGLVIFSALLSLLIIGIPILLTLIWVGIIIKIFGRVVLFYFFGESLARAFGSQKPSTIWAVMLGLLLVSILSFIPLLGFLFTFCLSIIGWGVVVRTKFGTTENWFRRK
jgi:hypothetical protein